MSVHISTTRRETRFVRATLLHPRKGLTLDDLEVVLNAARSLEMPGDTAVHTNISYGEGSFRGGISCEAKVDLPVETEAE